MNRTTSSATFLRMTQLQFFMAVLVMGTVVVGSNILVQYPINQWLTWGAISYPVAFLVADVLNRRFGPRAARQVAVVGFIAALVVSFWVATPRIAVASGLAFLCAQLLDIQVFDRLREQRWWRAPLLGGIAGATLDTIIFFSVAFAGTGVHWVALLLGDLAVKLFVNATMLAPFRALMWNVARPAVAQPRSQ
ncbi:MAG TPA: VUT family protein [Eoetvoesiella sp.]